MPLGAMATNGGPLAIRPPHPASAVQACLRHWASLANRSTFTPPHAGCWCCKAPGPSRSPWPVWQRRPPWSSRWWGPGPESVRGAAVPSLRAVGSSRWVDDEQGAPAAFGHRMGHAGGHGVELSGPHTQGLAFNHHKGFVVRVGLFFGGLAVHAQHLELAVAQPRDDVGAPGLRERSRLLAQV